MREMKNSGVEWIGEIPIDWDVVKVSYLFRIGRGRVIAQTELEDNGKYPVYSSQTKNDGCLGYINTYDFDLEQITWTTDGANAGTIFLRKGKHNCTNVCGTLQPLNPYIDLRYQKYALEYIAFYHKRADTNGFKIMNNEMAAIHTICPSLPEQHRIADFLDEKCAKIDAVIEKQKQVIEKLKEYKLSVITEAVTKGLDPTVPMKDSGVEYAKIMPAHWENRKMISILSMRVVDGPHESPELFDEGIPYISATAIENGKIDFEKMRGYISEEYCDECDKRYKPQINDILIVKLGASTGQVAIVETDRRFNIWVPLAVVRCNDFALPKFVYYAFQSDYFIKQMEQSWTYGTQQTLGVKTIERLRILIPNIEEQKVIVAFLEEKCSQFDSAISKKQAIVEKLTEYKKSLIYEVVTGKREV